MSALLGTFVSLKTMSDGGVRITLDMQCTLADMAPMGLIPGVPFGIARITGESSIAPIADPVEPKDEPIRAGQLCIVACGFCKDRYFWRWIETQNIPCGNESDARDFILDACHIDSRKQIDTEAYAPALFHKLIREPFMEWKANYKEFA